MADEATAAEAQPSPAVGGRSGRPLSAAFVRTVTAPGKYHDGGGLGLLLRVEPTGSKRWVQRLTIGHRRREIGLGSPPVVTLAMAREAALANARLARDGVDPVGERRRARETLSFAQAVDRHLSSKLDEFSNAKHRAQWRSTLDSYAGPVIGALPVAQIAVADVLRVLQPIWATRTETASRLRGRIEAVLSWATVAGHRTGDNPARWKGNLDHLLPKPAKIARSGNQPALALADTPRWFAAVAQRPGAASLALRFAALTAARSGEVRGALWSEIDPEARVWTVPAERMKAGRAHRVPLTAPALAIIEAARSLPAGRAPLIFPAPSGVALSDMALSAVMRRVHAAATTDGDPGFVDPRSGRPAVPHGLRSTFRDWAAEGGYERDMAEIALAHTVGSAVERAYRRSDMLERRRSMMSAWAGLLTGAPSTAAAVPLRGRQ
ncbi:tyrosine-type recombinase/integrase [Paracoccus endophyticus]|uniref:tyrosine-type recombinase/integrase n=1 Tax=Paracoccus endophyticus TaxID=2233774 RepID=UPI000DD859E1|nr:site-specific integrase [Paracoccus endophyticus]